MLLPCLLFAVSDVYADNKLTFGYFGANGLAGDDGRPGVRGRDLVVRVDGSSQDFDLSGTDGAAGRYGGDGDDARDCNQPNRPNRNVRAASGGDGGDGGRGGDGGDGGNITLLYQQIEDLKNIRVVARGGVGGAGAQGGRGGRACSCYEYSWSVRECKDEKQSDGSSQRVCKNHPKSCVDGSYGQQGDDGYDGREGKLGAVYLVKDVNDWAPSELSKRIPLNEIEGSSYILTEHFFTPESGVVQMLAPGSYVNDKYFEYERTEQEKIKVNWLSRRPRTDFSHLKLQLDKVGKEITHKIDGALTLFEQESTPERTLSIKKIVSEGEARRLEFSIQGEGAEAKIVLYDVIAHNDDLSDVISMKLSTKRLIFGWRKRLDRVLDQAEFKKIDGHYEIALKDLGFKKKMLKPGRKLKIHLNLSRSLGDDSITVEFSEKVSI